MRAARRETLKQIVELFAEGLPAVTLPPLDPHLAAFALLGMCNWIAMWFKPDQKQSAEAVAEQYVEIALAAFGRHGAGARSGRRVPATIARMREDLARLERLTRAT